MAGRCNAGAAAYAKTGLTTITAPGLRVNRVFDDTQIAHTL